MELDCTKNSQRIGETFVVPELLVKYHLTGKLNTNSIAIVIFTLYPRAIEVEDEWANALAVNTNENKKMDKSAMSARFIFLKLQ
jgi:hypothetical protein